MGRVCEEMRNVKCVTGSALGGAPVASLRGRALVAGLASARPLRDGALAATAASTVESRQLLAPAATLLHTARRRLPPSARGEPARLARHGLRPEVSRSASISSIPIFSGSVLCKETMEKMG